MLFLMRMLGHTIRVTASCLILHASCVLPVAAQPPGPSQTTQASAQHTANFTVQQIDALLAPIALYPDALLTQMLIASTFPLQVVAAARWLKEPGRADLKGDALTKALEPLDWDPSVKSLIPFPQALSQLDNNLEWTQQLGYAFANQQKEVLDSVQRLRRQAMAEGSLKSTSQQTVLAEEAGAPAPSVATGAGTPAATVIPPSTNVVIQPTDPDVVYVPSYNPATVYGAWPYPTYPPVAAYPAPVYVPGTALASGLAFGAGIAITAGLWGWAGSNWNSGDVNINANRWNNINTNRTRTAANTWSPTLNRAAGRTSANLSRPPAGPVGRPGRNTGLPANAIGRASVDVAPGLVDRPRPPAGAGNLPNRPNLSPGSRPGAGQGQRPGGSQRPGTGQGQRPGGGQVQRPSGRPSQLPARQPGQGGGFQGPGGPPGGGVQRPPGGGLGSSPGAQRPGGFGGQRSAPSAFGGVGEGNRAAAYGQRGTQSRQFGGSPQFGGRGGGGFQGGGMTRGGGGSRGGGGGGFRGGGGGSRGGGGRR